MQAATQVPALRGHEPLRLSVKPSFANLLVWKAIYEHEDSYYVDAARGAQMTWFPGARVPKLDLAVHFPGVNPIPSKHWMSSVFAGSPTIICHPWKIHRVS